MRTVQSSRARSVALRMVGLIRGVTLCIKHRSSPAALDQRPDLRAKQADYAESAEVSHAQTPQSSRPFISEAGAGEHRARVVLANHARPSISAAPVIHSQQKTNRDIVRGEG